MKKNKKITKESWKGVGIVGRGGFGIINLHTYLNRNDLKRNLKKIKKFYTVEKIN